MHHGFAETVVNNNVNLGTAVTKNEKSKGALYQQIRTATALSGNNIIVLTAKIGIVKSVVNVFPTT